MPTRLTMSVRDPYTDQLTFLVEVIAESPERPPEEVAMIARHAFSDLCVNLADRSGAPE